jgi:peptidoglycan/LPS O-acetylase OafA/YrhL
MHGGPAAVFPFLDAWRVISALTVISLHFQMQGFLPSEVPSLLRIGHLAVIVFFVISGYSVAYAAHQHLGQPKAFLIARCSRIYTIAIPAMAFALVVDQLAGIQNSPLYPVWQYPKWWLHLAFNALFLGELWIFSLQPFSIAPYWSLSYEFWFYVLMSLMMLPASILRTLAIIAMLIFLGPKICLLLPCWLLGVWAFRQSLKPAKTISNGAWLGSIGFLLLGWSVIASGADTVLLGLSKYIDQQLQLSTGGLLKLSESRYFLGDYLFAGSFTAAILLAARTKRSTEIRLQKIRALIGWLAPHTFALYLFHYTLLVFVTTKLTFEQRQSAALMAAFAIITICLLIATVLAPTRKYWAQLLARAFTLKPGRATKLYQ